MAKYNFKKDVKEILKKEKKTFVGINDKEYTFEFDMVFSRKKQEDFVKLLISTVKAIRDKGEVANYEMIYEYLLIKTFTNIIDVKNDDLYIETLEGLDTILDIIELGIYEDILLSFDKNEIEKFNKKTNEIMNQMNNVVEKMVEKLNTETGDKNGA